jgi:hypothetical protein
MLNDLARSISSLLLCNNSITSIDNTQLSLYLGYKRKVSCSHCLHIQSYKCIRVFCSSDSLCSSSHVRPTGATVCVTHIGASSSMPGASPIKFKAILILNLSAVTSPAFSALTSSDFVHLHPIANLRTDSLKATGALPAAWPGDFSPRLSYPNATGFGPSARPLSGRTYFQSRSRNPMVLKPPLLHTDSFTEKIPTIEFSFIGAVTAITIDRRMGGEEKEPSFNRRDLLG